MEENTYICSLCKKYKSKAEFPKSTRNKYRDGLSCVCKQCYKEVYGQHRKNIEEAKSLDYILKVRLHDAQVRAKRKNIFIDITLEYLHKLWNSQNGKCALTGFPMTCVLFNGKKNKYNVSIDRIDCNKGYEIGNIQLVCSAVNMMKGELTIKELKTFCQAIINKEYVTKSKYSTDWY